MKNLSGIALAAAVALCVVGIAREAFASSANCKRHVTRTWDEGTGDWVYVDGGCPQVLCTGNPSGQCSIWTTPGTNEYQCICPDGTQPPCVPTVHYGVGGPDSAYCLDETCLDPNWCPATWTPVHGEPQVLTCPCVP